MKILYCINNLAGGGAEKLVFELVQYLTTLDNDVSVLILNDKNDKYSSILKTKKIGIVCLSNKNFFQKLYTLLIYPKKFQILHLHLFPTFYIFAIIKFINNIFRLQFPKLVFTEHNTFNSRRKYKILRKLEVFIYKQLDFVISITDGTQSNLLYWLNQKKSSKFKVIFNGINLESFSNISGKNLSLLVKNYQSTDKILCCVGRLTDQKNQSYLIDVMAHLPLNFKLLIVGDGELFGLISSKIKKLKLESRVILLGFRTDIPEILKAVDLVLIPSKWEGFGLIAVESLACSKNILYSDVDGLKEIMDGYGFPANVNEHPNSFAKEIMAIDYNKYSNQFLMNRAKDFDIIKMVDNYLSIYKNLEIKQ
jgi:glycosyltransferase involved in cell wall biosynthesis